MTWGELMRGICAPVGLELWELPRRAVGGALRDYCWRAAKVRVSVRLGDRRYHDYYEVRSAGRRRRGFGVQSLAKLREGLGPFVADMDEVLWADPFQRQLPSPADNGLVVPVVVPPEHEELVRELVRELVDRVRPGVLPEVHTRRKDVERARAWLARHAGKLQICRELLGRDAVLQVMDGT